MGTSNVSRSKGIRSSLVVSRRRLFRNSALVGAGIAGAALVGCSSARQAPATNRPPQTAGTGAVAAPERPGAPVVKGAPKEGGTFTQATTVSNVQHDMHTALAGSVWHNISEPALLPDPLTGAITANIIEKWEVPDSTHFVFKVRPGVKLHNKPPWNGREFDADDLAFNINRIAGNTAAAEGISVASFQRRDTLAGMERVEAVDKSTVRVTMARPSSAYLKGFLEWRNLMMPKGVVEVGFKDPLKLAGTGAFQLTEYTPDVREVTSKHPGYFRTGQPYFEKAVSTVVSDQAAIIAGFISKQFSILAEPSPADEKTVLAARPDALLYSSPGGSWFYLWPSARHAPLGDFRVRKALQLAIDYEEIGAGYSGSGWAYTSPLFSGYPEGWHEDKLKSMAGYNPRTKAKDRDDAQKLMAAAGHANGEGIPVEIATGTGTGNFGAHNAASLRFQGQMQKLFPAMKLTIRVIADRAQHASTLAAGNFQMFSYSSAAQPDAASEAWSLYHSKGGRNYGKIANPEIDALLDKALIELDSKARTELLATFQDRCFNDWLPILSLYVQPRKSLLQPTIGGFDKITGPSVGNGGLPHRLGSLYSVV